MNETLIERLRRAGSIAALTGAGVSAESGIPTFRDAQTGLWARYDPQELATPEAFRRDPRLADADHRGAAAGRPRTRARRLGLPAAARGGARLASREHLRHRSRACL